MRQLLPVPAEVDPVQVHAEADRSRSDGRPWLLVNMVTSLDGASSFDGRSEGLANPADKAVFSAIRAVGDVILVAAGTARAETYGPPRTPPSRSAERVARGQRPFPRIAVVTRSADLDPTTPFFTEAHERPIVLTVAEAPPERIAALSEVAEVVVVGRGDVDPAASIGALADFGANTIVCEGGPQLNAHLLHADLIDELDLSISPLVVGGESTRIVHAAAGDLARRMRLAHLWEADGMLLGRWVRDR